MGTIHARCRVDTSTKRVTPRVKPGEIVIVSHSDLDEVAAQALAARRPSAVLNARPFLTGRYPARGARILLDSGVLLVDCLGPSVLTDVADGSRVTVRGAELTVDRRKLATGRVLTPALAAAQQAAARRNLRREFDRFVDNTVSRAVTEKPFVLGTMSIPHLQTTIAGRPAVVVVRGRWYEEDLQLLDAYIRDVSPALIGVDGGADALVSLGHRPDIVIGDMDSVSDATLRRARDIVVHAYQDGSAPGLARVQALGLPAEVFACPGTSEDAALLLAFEHDAELIVGVGTHRGLIDFLDKGRPGMASTLLVRLLVGPILIDANGVSRLYRPGFHWNDVALVAGAGLLPLIAVLSRGPLSSTIIRALLLRLRILLLGQGGG